MPLVERGPRAFPLGTARTPGRASLRLGRTGRPGDGGVPVLYWLWAAGDGGVPVPQVGRAAGDGGVPVLYWLWPAGDGGVPVLYWLWPGKDPEFAAIRASSKGGR